MLGPVKIVEEVPAPRILEDGKVVLRETTAAGTRDVEYVRADEVEASWALVEEQFAKGNAELRELRAALRAARDELGRARAYAPDLDAPCLACWGEVEPTGPWVGWPCCGRVMHLECCQSTVFRKPACRVDRCPACLSAEALERVADIRAAIAAEEAPPRADNRAKHTVCRAAGLLRDVPLRGAYDHRTIDRIDEAWMSLRGAKLAQAGVTVEQVLAAGVPLSLLLLDLGVDPMTLIPGAPGGLGMHAADLWRCGRAGRRGSEVGHLSRAGLSAEILRHYRLPVKAIRTDTEPAADPEVLCALGISAYDLLAMGLRMDHMARINWSFDHWHHYLGADALWVRLLFQDAAALEGHGWRADAVAAVLGVPEGSLFT